jgi:acyl-coenzyme A thioesterase PaaI-like protein
MLEALTRLMTNTMRLSGRLTNTAISPVIWRAMSTKVTEPPIKKNRSSFINPDCEFNKHHLKATLENVGLNSAGAAVNFSYFGNNRSDLTNSAQTMHGGAIASLHDLAACKTLHDLGYKGATTSMNITFTKPAKIGEELQVVIAARAKLLGVKNSLASLESILYRITSLGEDEIGSATLTFKVWK